ncbi:GNAT family N-acetyltransferase [Clostridium manihotivorum]|uniref:GNAT family N-acetyltransferase n=1 Tax=Clostridium manihotivorum TaxID=2320868 RepID=A0A410DTX4_9CLOT|nr:GNAT family N-acetyltransferase [Clostridium manihotivorum]QAA32470.1 GNAT family N-acetyltransferase [Clostridium manihotivorum]
MKDYIIKESNKEDWATVDTGIVEYNASKVPFTQAPAFIPLNRVIKNSEGETLAGINTMIYCWNCLYVDVLWVKEGFRDKGYGSILLKEVETIAKEKGCKLIHLDTFDFQAKDFYLKHGYEVFGILEDCPESHNRYYLKKTL